MKNINKKTFWTFNTGKKGTASRSQCALITAVVVTQTRPP